MGEIELMDQCCIYEFFLEIAFFQNGEKTKLDTDVNLAELAASEKCHGYR